MMNMGIVDNDDADINDDADDDGGGGDNDDDDKNYDRL